jgi:hypothetical protein
MVYIGTKETLTSINISFIMSVFYFLLNNANLSLGFD